MVIRLNPYMVTRYKTSDLSCHRRNNTVNLKRIAFFKTLLIIMADISYRTLRTAGNIYEELNSVSLLMPPIRFKSANNEIHALPQYNKVQ